MRAEKFKPFHKFVVVIAGSTRGSSKWKKGPSMPKDKAVNPMAVSSNPSTNFQESIMETEPPVQYEDTSHTSSITCGESKLSHEKERVIAGLSEGVAKLGRETQKQLYDYNAQAEPKQGGGVSASKKGEILLQRDRTLLQDMTNSQINLPNNATLKTWKKIACEVNTQQENVNSPTSFECKPLMELDEPQPVKKRRMQIREVVMKDYCKADAVWQLRQGQ